MIFVVLFKLYQNEMILYDKCKNVLTTGLLYKNIYKTVYMNGFIHFFSFLSKKEMQRNFKFIRVYKMPFFLFLSFNFHKILTFILFGIACCYVSGTTKNDK